MEEGRDERVLAFAVISKNGLALRDAPEIYRGDPEIVAAITSAVKGKLVSLARSNKITNNYNFHIETTNGHVHIFGKTSNSQDISVIEREVERIKGVMKVHCNISIM